MSGSPIPKAAGWQRPARDPAPRLICINNGGDALSQHAHGRVQITFTMKLAFVVHNELLAPQVLNLMRNAGIDYYTRWDQATGKGRGTEPHLGRGSFGSTNSVIMIAFQEEGPLEALIDQITACNREMKRADDRIRLFQVPLERVV